MSQHDPFIRLSVIGGAFGVYFHITSVGVILVAEHDTSKETDITTESHVQGTTGLWFLGLGGRFFFYWHLDDEKRPNQ